MPKPTQEPPEQDSPANLAPRPNPILAEPATPASCQQDYAEGADVRSRLGWRDAS